MDYSTAEQPGVECRCGAELTVADEEMDYVGIIGGQRVQTVSFIFIKHFYLKLCAAQPVPLASQAEDI